MSYSPRLPEIRSGQPSFKTGCPKDYQTFGNNAIQFLQISDYKSVFLMVLTNLIKQFHFLESYFVRATRYWRCQRLPEGLQLLRVFVTPWYTGNAHALITIETDLTMHSRIHNHWSTCCCSVGPYLLMIFLISSLSLMAGKHFDIQSRADTSMSKIFCKCCK